MMLDSCKRENGTTQIRSIQSRIGNMSSNLSTSFSYTSSNISTSSFTELFKLTNIVSGRGQVKLNLCQIHASFSFNTSNWNTGHGYSNK